MFQLSPQGSHHLRYLSVVLIGFKFHFSCHSVAIARIGHVWDGFVVELLVWLVKINLAHLILLLLFLIHISHILIKQYSLQRNIIKLLKHIFISLYCLFYLVEFIQWQSFVIFLFYLLYLLQCFYLIFQSPFELIEVAEYETGDLKHVLFGFELSDVL